MEEKAENLSQLNSKLLKQNIQCGYCDFPDPEDISFALPKRESPSVSSSFIFKTASPTPKCVFWASEQGGPSLK